MALITGTPLGVVNTQEDLFIEGAPTIFFQDHSASPDKNPDSDGFYYGLTGSATYPVYEVGCLSDLSFGENVTANDILCDNVGFKDTILQRENVQFSFTVKSIFPILNMAQLLNLGAVTQNAGEGTEKSGIGKINNSQFWHVWSPAVYDTVTGDYVAIHLHKVKFVGPWTLNTPFGDAWNATGITMRAFVDSDYPAAQQYGMILRVDPSVI
jgi:hypothetical protein